MNHKPPTTRGTRQTLLVALLLFAGVTHADTKCDSRTTVVAGDPALARISATGVAHFTCRVDLGIGNYRGRVNYVAKPSAAADVWTRSRVLRMDGIAGTGPSGVNVSGKSIIFAMQLAQGRALHLALVAAQGKFKLKVDVVNVNNFTSTNIGATELGPGGGFHFELRDSGKQGINLVLATEQSKVEFTINEALGDRGTAGWSYGLIGFGDSDNFVPYTWIMGHGPAPVMAFE